jgi:hypothetical protein
MHKEKPERRPSFPSIVVSTVFALAATDRVLAQNFTFTKIVDSTAQVPNSTGSFGEYPGVRPFYQVCLSQGHAYFVGREQGIYEAFEGNLSRDHLNHRRLRNRDP